MTKDEMKNRISMALKDPILQQGFEIICKENAELRKELEEADNATDCFNKQEEIIVKAKNIIIKLLEVLIVIDGEQTRELKEVKEAEQFLREVEQ